MPVLFKCVCGKKLKAPDKLAGKAIKCPACGKAIRVPKPSKPSEAKPETGRPPAPPGQGPGLASAPLSDLTLEDDSAHGPDQPSLTADDQPLDFGPDMEPSAAEGQAPPQEDQDAPAFSFDESDHGPGESAEPPPSQDSEAPFEFALEPNGEFDAFSPSPPPEQEADAGFQLDMGGDDADDVPIEQSEPTIEMHATEPHDDLAAGQAPTVEDTSEAYDIGFGDESPGGECPKCGAGLPQMAVICVQCGQRLDEPAESGEEPEPAPPTSRTKDSPDAKKLAIGFGVGVLALALVVGGLIFLLRSGSEAPSPPERTVARDDPDPPPDPADRRRADERQRRDRPDRPDREERAERPTVATDWGEFEAPELRRRDAARKLADAIAAHREANDGQLPGSEDLDGLLAGFAYASALTPARVALVAWEEEAVDGVRYGVFNDGTVRGLTEAQRAAAQLEETPYGLLTSEEMAILQGLRPSLRLVNERFGRLTMLVDGEEAVTVGQYETALVPVEGGVREIAFKANGATSAAIQMDCRPGVVAELGFRRHATRPVVRAWEIQRASTRRPRQRNPRHVIEGGRLVQVRMGDYDVFNIGESSLRVFRESRRYVEGSSCRAIDGRIRYANREIVGPARGPLGRARHDERTIRSPDRDPILVSVIERLAEGDVFYDSGAVEHYRILDEERDTRFGSVCVLVTPATTLAEFVRSVSPQAERPPQEPRALRGRAERAPPRGQTGREEAPARSALPEPLRFSWPRMGKQVDLQAIREPVAELGRPARDDLMDIVRRGLQEPGRPDRDRREMDFYDAYDDPGYIEDDYYDDYDAEDGGGTRAAADEEVVERTEPAARILTPQEALALVGLYSVQDLSGVLRQIEERRDFQRAAVLGMGFGGDLSVAAGIASMARADRVGAILGLAAIEAPQAQVAMSSLVSGASSDQLVEAMRAAPRGLGPLARQRLLSVIKESFPGEMRDQRFLEAACRFVPGAQAEGVLFAALGTDPAAPEPEAPEPDRAPRREDEDEYYYDDYDDYDDYYDDYDDAMPGPDQALFDDPVDATRLWAARVLASLGHRKTIAWLVETVESGSDQDKALAVFALRETADASLVGALSRGLALSEALARGAATDALLKIGNEDALALVRHRLEDQGDIAFRLTLDAAVGPVRQEAGEAAAARLLASLWRGALKHAEPPPEEERDRRGRDPMDDEYFIDDDYYPMDPARGGRSARRGAPAEAAAPTAPLDMVRPLDVLRAAREIAAYHDDLFAALGEGLEHESPQVRAAAVSALPGLIEAGPARERDRLFSRAVELAEGLTGDSSMRVAAAAVDTIARVRAMRGDHYVPDLASVRRGLEARNADEVVAALELATGFSKNEDLPGLLQTVLFKYSGAIDNPDAPRILAKLAETFGNIGSADAAPLLRQLLRHEDRGVRLAAVRALGRIGGDRSAEFLAEALEDRDDEVKRAAILALARVPDGLGIPPLAVVLLSERDPRAAPGRPDRYDDPYDDAYYDPDHDHRHDHDPRRPDPAQPDDLKTLVITEALRHGTPQAFQGLRTGVSLDDVAGLRLVAELAPERLSEGAEDAYVGFLSGYLASGNARVRALAAEAIRSMVSAEQAVAILKPHAGARPVGILPALAEAAVELGDVSLAERFEDWYPEGRISARPQRTAPGMEDIHTPATPVFDDIELESRVAVFMAIGRLGGEEAVTMLRRTLFGRKVQSALVRVQRVDRAGRPFNGLSDPDAEVYRAYIRANAATGKPDAVRAIASRDTPPNHFFRSEVTEALAECGHLDPDEARAALMACLNDPSLSVRAAAAHALDDIRNRLQEHE